MKLTEAEKQAAELLRKQQFTAAEHVSISAAIDSLYRRAKIARPRAAQILNAYAFSISNH